MRTGTISENYTLRRRGRLVRRSRRLNGRRLATAAALDREEAGEAEDEEVERADHLWQQSADRNSSLESRHWRQGKFGTTHLLSTRRYSSDLGLPTKLCDYL